jgi:HlyD family secretion protein
VGEVAIGQKAYFTVQAYPKRTFWGTVRQIRRGPITVQNVVTYDVVVDVANEDLALFPGMTADAHIITAEHTHVLRVPLPATRFVPEGVARRAGDGPARPRGDGAGRRSGGGRAPHARIWLLVNGALKEVPVRTGLDDGTLIEVDSPELAAGDAVVVNAIKPESGSATLVSEGPQQQQRGANRQGGPRF